MMPVLSIKREPGCGLSTQTILFPVDKWSKSMVERWLHEHKFKSDSVELRSKHYRARQYDPSKNLSYKTKELKSKGIKLIMAKPRSCAK